MTKGWGFRAARVVVSTTKTEVRATPSFARTHAAAHDGRGSGTSTRKGRRAERVAASRRSGRSEKA